MGSIETIAGAHRCVIALGVLACVPFAASLAGPITYISQSRRVSAVGVGPSGYINESKEALDFGVFDEKVEPGVFAKGIAQQTSTLGESAIKATGEGTGMHYINVMNTSGTSDFYVAFEIDVPVNFALLGTLNLSGCSSPTTGSLSFEGTTFYWLFKTSLNNPRITIDEAGTLMPGTYWLHATGVGTGQSGMCFGGTGSYNFSLELTPICYPDCDQSGSLDIDDFICFQTLYAIGDPTADCDQSGELNIDDFICFQTLYAIGC